MHSTALFSARIFVSHHYPQDKSNYSFFLIFQLLFGIEFSFDKYFEGKDK